ncbi:MAG: DUF4124 domain-containing protein [Pseudomonadota bacterium]|jgi:glutaredoxin
MRLATLLSGLLLAGAAGAGDIYRWTDAQGRVHFGDRPPAASVPSQVAPAPNLLESVPARPAAPRREVVLYSTQRCGFCRQARAHFRARGIPYTEYDVETTAQGRRDYRRMNGRGVPIILIDGQRMDGFSASRFDRQYGAP